jgi:hypothetical protein
MAVFLHLVFHLTKASSVQRMRVEKFVRGQGSALCGSDVSDPGAPKERAGERQDHQCGSCDKDGGHSADTGDCQSWGLQLHRRILLPTAIPARCA